MKKVEIAFISPFLPGSDNSTDGFSLKGTIASIFKCLQHFDQFCSFYFFSHSILPAIIMPKILLMNFFVQYFQHW